MAKRKYNKTGKYAKNGSTRSYPRLKTKIIALLKENDLWNDVDRILVNNLIDTIEISDLSMTDIRTRGVVVPFNDESTNLIKNPSISSYKDSTRLIVDISKKLGMSARDRFDLGLVKDIEQDDGF